MADSRLRKAADLDRDSRDALEREATENRELIDDERLEELMTTLYQEHLPRIPPIPGYHVCWLTTESKVDSIAWRQSIGYQLIKANEIPGFEHLASVAGAGPTGQYPGTIAVAEMVAAKIPEKLYQRYMALMHHKKPADEATKLTNDLEALADQAKRYGGRIGKQEGLRDIDKPAPVPVFQ
jgi:hypothetical protein